MGDREETIQALLKDAPRSVRGLFRARLRGVEKLRSKGKKTGPVLETIERDLVNAIDSYERRKRSVPEITYPEDLPVSARRDEIKNAIRDHQVVIVCGETGSGKTTQLPKICLELGRGVDGMIAHTQPRRIAARSVAARVAQELGVGLGSAVGYKIRFGDQTTDDTLVKVMTDGILLAETRSDRELRSYDTIIVDEAHERSLNIDFLLGSLRRLIERRPDLKLIITSATLDAGRFAEHFANGDEPAPVIEVQGRTYPVETRYRPEEVLNGMPVPEAASHAASELVLEGHDDVLVFMPGEREIRETAHELRKREYLPDNVDIVPLYARLSPQEQQRVFKPGHAPRIVIATNVAETSITVPRIRSVVDPGLARMNRYNPRTKLHGLMIEPISQASSAQRAGRCGRIAPGVCVRLFDRDDFDRRDEYTQPELLRSNLASVILQMIDLKLGEPEDFPFVDRPDHRQWRDGFETLHELGAIDDAHALTDIGRKMARLPVDPRIARMILAAHDEGCLHDVLIIAAALSTQDPRVRPHDKQDAADQAHEIFRVEGSDFLSFLRIWDWYHESHEKLTRRKLQRACEKQFLAPRRIDEWREVYRQLRGLCQEIKLEVKPRHTEDPDSVHRALLAGLLTNIGTKGERHEYKGTRNTAFMINPGSVVFEDKPAWVIAGEIVRTTKVYARTVARVNPKWIEDAAKHLISKTYSNPRYEEKTGRVVADERVTLYGLDLIPRRTVHFGPIDPKSSRELFIHHALVEGELKTRSVAMKRNKSLLSNLRNMEAKARRGDLIADNQAIFNFYDARLPEDVYSGKSFERFAAKHEGELTMREEDLVLAQDAKVTHETHPDFVRVGARDAGLSYTFMPGDLLDGVTVRVRVEDLPHVTRETLEWSVPGFHREMVEFLIKSLPKSIRRQFDAPALAQELTPRLSQGEGSVGAQLAAMLSNKAGVTIRPEQFRSEQVPEHLSPRISVLDEHGKEIASGRDLKAMKERFRDAAHKAVDEAAEGFNRDGLTDWDLDEFPEKVEFEDQGRKVSGFAAMVVDGAAVNLRVRTSKWVAEHQTRAAQGLLIGLGVARELKLRPQQMPGYSPLSVAGAACGFSRDDIKAAMLARTGMSLTIDEHGIVRDRGEFDARLTRAWDNGNKVMLDTIAKLSSVVGSISKAKGIVGSEHPPAWRGAIVDIKSQIEVLTQGDWLLDTPTRWLLCFPRYVRAMEVRLERLRNIGPERDSAMVRQVEPWARCVKELRDQGAHTDDQVAENFETLFWMVQEWRVATFAQELRTSVPVSDKRLRAQLDTIIHAG